MVECSSLQVRISNKTLTCFGGALRQILIWFDQEMNTFCILWSENVGTDNSFKTLLWQTVHLLVHQAVVFVTGYFLHQCYCHPTLVDGTSVCLWFSLLLICSGHWKDFYHGCWAQSHLFSRWLVWSPFPQLAGVISFMCLHTFLLGTRVFLSYHFYNWSNLLWKLSEFF